MKVQIPRFDMAGYSIKMLSAVDADAELAAWAIRSRSAALHCGSALSFWDAHKIKSKCHSPWPECNSNAGH